MKNSHPPNLVLVVPSRTSNPRTWVLEPQGRNTFKIVVHSRESGAADSVAFADSWKAPGSDHGGSWSGQQCPLLRR